MCTLKWSKSTHRQTLSLIHSLLLSFALSLYTLIHTPGRSVGHRPKGRYWGERHLALTAGGRYYLITSGLEMDPPQIQPAKSVSVGSWIHAYCGAKTVPSGWVLDCNLALKTEHPYFFPFFLYIQPSGIVNSSNVSPYCFFTRIVIHLVMSDQGRYTSLLFVWCLLYLLHSNNLQKQPCCEALKSESKTTNGLVGGMWSSGLVDKSHQCVIYRRHIPHFLADVHCWNMQGMEPYPRKNIF